ncbi:Glucose/arabinose dehydrogenase OS=Streptomyces albaduncus OX=68172 GN=FHS32_005539 PE=4 SV=1 [Streptomyces griseoloalbus]
MTVDYVRVSASGGTGNSGDGGNGGATKTGAIKGVGGMCVDVAGASAADGTPIQLHDCTGVDAQRWTLGSDGTVRALGKCLDVRGGSTADGAAVQLYTCNGTKAQQWVHTSARDLTNVGADKCLATKDNASGDGTPLQIRTCSGAANQKWTLA